VDAILAPTVTLSLNVVSKNPERDFYLL
jgi:hypothetical protein